MKITKENKNGLEAKISNLIEDIIDQEAVKDFVRQNKSLIDKGTIEYKEGKLDILNDEVVYKLNFEVKHNISFAINKDGEVIRVEDASSLFPQSQEANKESLSYKDKITKTMDQIAQIANEINK